MKMRRQAGFTLIESLAAAAIVTLAVVAFAGALGGFGRYASHQASPVRTAASALAEQTLRVAADAWKYGSPGTAPAGSFATSVPVVTPDGGPTGEPVGVTVTSGASARSAQVGVTVRYTPDPSHPGDTGVVSLSGAAPVRAPLPGSAVAPGRLIAQPTGAP